MTTAVCDWFGKLRQLTADGVMAAHLVSLPVSRAAVASVGRGQVRRRCSGSGRPPRRAERAPP
jgi:hypothetical protein